MDKPLKTVYVFGAGYSCYANFPVQSDILPRIYKLDKGIVGNSVDYITSVYGKEFIPSLEDVYTLLDRAISRRDNFGGKSFNELDEIRTSLTKAILYVINSCSDEFFRNKKITLGIDKKLNKEKIYDFKSNNFYKTNAAFFLKKRIESKLDSDTFSIISLNWDTLFEDSLYELKPSIKKKHKFDIDYCCYTYPLTDSSHTSSLTQKSRKIFNIKLLKLHSSANWLICPNCNRLFTGLGSKKNFWSLYIDAVDCPKCSAISKKFLRIDKSPVLFPFLISPTFLKDIDNNTHINMVWHNAFVELVEADKIVFIGYSLPDSDYMIRTLLKRSIKKNTSIEVVLKEYDNYSKTTSKYLRNFFAAERYKHFFPESLYKLKFHYNGVEGYFSKIHGKRNFKNLITQINDL